MFLLLISSFLSEFIYKLSTSERFWIFGLGSLNLLVLFICSTFFIYFSGGFSGKVILKPLIIPTKQKTFLLEEREKRERES
jgi:hypothetical protein